MITGRRMDQAAQRIKLDVWEDQKRTFGLILYGGLDIGQYTPPLFLIIAIYYNATSILYTTADGVSKVMGRGWEGPGFLELRAF